MVEIMERTTEIEIQYSVIRFMALLIQSFDKFVDGQNSLELTARGDEEQIPYGTLLCYQFCTLFRKVYFPKKLEKQDFSESFKNDV